MPTGKWEEKKDTAKMKIFVLSVGKSSKPAKNIIYTTTLKISKDYRNKMSRSV